MRNDKEERERREEYNKATGNTKWIKKHVSK